VRKFRGLGVRNIFIGPLGGNEKEEEEKGRDKPSSTESVHACAENRWRNHERDGNFPVSSEERGLSKIDSNCARFAHSSHRQCNYRRTCVN